MRHLSTDRVAEAAEKLEKYRGSGTGYAVFQEAEGDDGLRLLYEHPEVKGNGPAACRFFGIKETNKVTFTNNWRRIGLHIHPRGSRSELSLAKSPSPEDAESRITETNLKAALKENKKLVEALDEARAYTENIVEALINKVGRVRAVPYRVKTIHKAEDSQPETAMLELSDWHLGGAWPNQDTGFGEMSTDILNERVQLLTQKTINLVSLQRRAAPIPNLHLNFLGDIVENDSLHPSSGIHVDNPTIRQMAAAVNAAERMVTTFLQHFEQVSATAVWGNHGRHGKKGEQHFANNWDNLFYHFLAERFRNEPRFKLYISTLPFMAYCIEGQPWVHCCLHGNDIPAPLSIPFYWVGRVEGNLSTLLDRPIHFLHLAHFHSGATLDKYNGTRLINGCLGGTSPHSITLGLASQAMQRLYGMHPEHEMTWEYRIHLEPRVQRELDENGMLTPYVQGIGELA